MSTAGLLLRLNCQWQTDPKRWLNSTLVSNPFPVTHNFLLTPEQLGQPAGEETYRCSWLELEGTVGLSSVQSAWNPSVGYRVWVFAPLQTRREWGYGPCRDRLSALNMYVFRTESPAALLHLQLGEVLLLWGILDPWASPSGEGMRDSTLARTYHPPRFLGLKEISN